MYCCASACAGVRAQAGDGWRARGRAGSVRGANPVEVRGGLEELLLEVVHVHLVPGGGEKGGRSEPSRERCSSGRCAQAQRGAARARGPSASASRRAAASGPPTRPCAPSGSAPAPSAAAARAGAARAAARAGRRGGRGVGGARGRRRPSGAAIRAGGAYRAKREQRGVAAHHALLPQVQPQLVHGQLLVLRHVRAVHVHEDVPACAPRAARSRSPSQRPQGAGAHCGGTRAAARAPDHLHRLVVVLPPLAELGQKHVALRHLDQLSLSTRRVAASARRHVGESGVTPSRGSAAG